MMNHGESCMLALVLKTSAHHHSYQALAYRPRPPYIPLSLFMISMVLMVLLPINLLNVPYLPFYLLMVISSFAF